jgi:hypothetical protein
MIPKIHQEIRWRFFFRLTKNLATARKISQFRSDQKNENFQHTILMKN